MRRRRKRVQKREPMLYNPTSDNPIWNREIRLLHGTSDRAWEEIQRKGLRDPYLTDHPDMAAYFAEMQALEDGGKPIVLTVKVKDLERLRVDRQMWEEPLDWIKRLYDIERDQEWFEAVREEYIDTPEDDEDWLTSLRMVHSVRHSGKIKPADLIVPGTECSPELRRFGEELREFAKDKELHRLVDRWCFGSAAPWEAGACGIFADALKLYLGRGASLWGIWGDLPIVEGIGHVAVRVGDCFLDADGASTWEELLERWEKRGIDEGEITPYSKTDHKGEVNFHLPTSRQIAAALEARFGPGRVG